MFASELSAFISLTFASVAESDAAAAALLAVVAEVLAELAELELLVALVAARSALYLAE